MNNVQFDDERNLSESEAVIMKAVWDYVHAYNEDISVPHLIDVLRENYGKDYARTTVVTFLLKISDKGFVRTYRRGKLSFVHVMKSIDSYRKKRLEDEIAFWYGGDLSIFHEVLESIEENGNQ